MQLEEIAAEVRSAVSRFSSLPVESIVGETQLIGPKAVLKSRELVEVLLSLEDFAEERLGAEFDWTSDSAMSQTRSVFRTVDALARHLYELQAA